MIKQFAHICIHTNDLKKTEIFYCELLGFTKKFNFFKDGKLFGFYIDLGNNSFLEFFYDRDVESNSSRMRHFCFEVDNIDEVIEKLRYSGLAVTDKSFGCDNSWQCWIKDPNGIQIEIQQYTEESSQFTGNDCIVDW